MTASTDGTALPRWVRTTFWSVVALEWTVALSAAAAFVWLIIQAALIFTCTPDRTVYSSGYSDEAWNAVRPGDTQPNVKARLGEPLQRWSHLDDEWWSYSRQATGTDDYRERKVRFDRLGRVLEKHEACYID